MVLLLIISTVAEAWNLAMFGNNRFFAFCISSRGLDEILTGRATEHEDDSVTEIAMVYTRDWMEYARTY